MFNITEVGRFMSYPIIPDDITDEALVAKIKAGELPYPYKSYSMLAPKVLFHNLLNYRPRYGCKPYAIVAVDQDLFPTIFDDGVYYTVLAGEHEYVSIDQITDYFNEDQRLLARRKDSPLTSIEYWNSNHGAPAVLEGLRRKGLGITAYTLREELYQQVKECTMFKTTLTKSVIEFLGAWRVLDPSAGWGDRLIGSIASRVQHYVGVDPNSKLVPGHQKILDALVPARFRDRYRMIYEPFNSARLPRGMTFDLVFTSPPFFDFESYTTDEGQSIVDYPKLEDWNVEFLMAMMYKAWEVLEINGHLAIHISDSKHGRYVELLGLFIELLPGACYRGVIASRGVAEVPRPVWVWQKRVIKYDGRTARVVDTLEQKYPSYVARLEKRFEGLVWQ